MAVTVRQGDTLSGIAARNGVSLTALLRANPQIKNANRVYPGQKLTLPGYSAQSSYQPSTASTGRYAIRPGDSLSSIGAKFGISWQALAAANGISNPNRIYAGQNLTIPRGGGSVPAAPRSAPAPSGRYVVQPGDTLGSIGARYGVSWTRIASANGISNPNRIYPGQALSIPGVNAGQVNRTAPAAPVPGPVSGGVSTAQLRAIIPTLSQARAERLLPYLNKAMVEGGITTPKRKAAFLAQLAHESVGLTAFEEYASGAAYEGRKVLGNIYPGDGVRYKGRGPIQLTGRSNYRAAGRALGIDLEGNPKRAADIDVGFRVAVWFWNSRNLNAYADARNFDTITYRINGGYNGKASRDTYYARARSVLGA